MGAEAETAQTVVLSFLGLLAVGWLLFAVLRMMRRSGYEVETLAFFLSTLGFAVIASDNPANLTKQLICLLGGIVIYLIIGWSLRDLSRAKKFRYLAAVGGMLLLLVNLVFGQENNGARNGSRLAASRSSRPSWSSSASSMSAHLRWTAS